MTRPTSRVRERRHLASTSIAKEENTWKAHRDEGRGFRALGLIGSKLVARLAGTATRHRGVTDTGVNTLTGEGLAEALGGAQVVVDVSNSPSFDDKAVLDFLHDLDRQALAAEKTADVGHHVALSVVGTERLQESGYFRAKLVQ